MDASGQLMVVPIPSMVQLLVWQPLSCERGCIHSLYCKSSSGCLTMRVQVPGPFTPTAESHFSYGSHQGNPIRNGFRSPSFANQNHFLLCFPPLRIHSHTPGIRHLSFQQWKYKRFTLLSYYSVGHWGSDWRIQILNTKDLTVSFIFFTLEYEHCWLSAFKTKGDDNI